MLDVGRGADARRPALLELVFAPDGRRIFALISTFDEADHEGLLAIEKWNVVTGERVAFPAKPVNALVSLWTRQLVFVGGGRTLCIQRAEGDGGQAVGIDMLSGKEKYNPPLGVGGASVSPDGRTGASCGEPWENRWVGSRSSWPVRGDGRLLELRGRDRAAQ